MKKPAIIALLFTLIFTLSACTTAEAEPPANSGVQVIAALFAPYDFARNVAGDDNGVSVSLLLPPGADSHHYEPSAADVTALSQCELFIRVGGGFDPWADKLIQAANNPGLTVLSLTDCVSLLEEEYTEGMEPDHDHEDEDETHTHEQLYDEHVWTSPVNAKAITAAITDALCAIDPNQTDTFRQNNEAYQAKLDELDAKYRDLAQNAVRKTIVFGDRFPFRYLTQTYGLTYFAAFPGCSEETEPSAATVVFLMEKIRSEGIPAIFHTEQSDGRMARTISDGTGAKILLLHACHSVTAQDLAENTGYLSLMEQNLEALKEALY